MKVDSPTRFWVQLKNSHEDFKETTWPEGRQDRVGSYVIDLITLKKESSWSSKKAAVGKGALLRDTAEMGQPLSHYETGVVL